MNADAPTTELMTTFFAAVTAVEDGKVDEIELERRTVRDNGGTSVEQVVTVIVRRHVRQFSAHPTGGPT